MCEYPSVQACCVSPGSPASAPKGLCSLSPCIGDKLEEPVSLFITACSHCHFLYLASHELCIKSDIIWYAALRHCLPRSLYHKQKAIPKVKRFMDSWRDKIWQTFLCSWSNCHHAASISFSNTVVCEPISVTKACFATCSFATLYRSSSSFRR